MSGLIIESAIRAAVHVGSSKVPSKIAKSSAALFTAFGGSKPSLPDLSFDYGALAPVISAETMTIHHTKHHNAYVTNLNASLAKLDAAMSAGDTTAIIALQSAIKFNGGGHINHTLFWENLTPEKNSPGPVLEAAILESFGDYASMKEKLTAKAVAVQGSGWGWLALDKATGRLDVVTCANQDPLLGSTGLVPLMGIDVWEHAYYVDYRNVRPDYVNAIWDVINWKVVEDRLNAAK